MRCLLAVAVALAVCAGSVSTAAGRVLRVGSDHGIRGQYGSIQAAVDAAHAGDWILIGPGDYKTNQVLTPRGKPDFPAGVLITTPDLHIRGMNRRTVIVDGTKPGSGACSAKASAQNFGLTGRAKEDEYAVAARARASGVNGLMVYKAANVSIENLTACNFLGGSRDAGNEIWWNGGADSGKVGGHGFHGAYLTTTSTYLKNKTKAGEFSAAQYGVFSSNWSGGTWDQIYASNFNDSGFYIGACQQVCDQTLNHGWAEYNALGFSGSNSGGRLIVKNSEWDNNEEGFNTNSQNGDEPSPQNGACPHDRISPITHTHSCWVFMHNYVHDNNNPNVPTAGSAAAGPVGTGVVVAGGRNDTVMDNRIVNNHAWGALIVNYPDSGPPCTGGTKNFPLLGNGSCLYDEWGNALIGNTFTHNGGYGNPTNGDFEQLNFETHPSNCFSGNVDTSGKLSPGAVKLEQMYPVCTTTPVPPNFNIPFLSEVLCDSTINVPPFGCQPGDRYPHATHIVMHPLPKHLQTMPHPCEGVPANPWCARRSSASPTTGLG
ncbi:MAG: hypothetical protein WAK93_01165 [Solirubrobacteraceae bacterium]